MESTTPAMAKSEQWAIDKLKLWDKNPKGIKPERLTELKERLKRQGQTKPLLVTADGVVIGGNQRLKAMRELGWKQVWVSVTTAATDREIFDLALTDNEEFGFYDRRALNDLALSLHLTPLELNSYELNLGSTSTLGVVLDGFADDDDEEQIPPLDRDYSHVRSEVGKVYQLGEHRLMCGDSTDPVQVEQLMDGAEADVVFTDPPYGVDSLGGRRQLAVEQGRKEIENDTLSGEALQEFLANAFGSVPMSEHASFYVCYPARTQAEFIRALGMAAWPFKHTLIWDKTSMGLGGAQGYRYQYELMAYGFMGDKPRWFGGHDQSDIWQIGRTHGHEGNHPTVKPVALIIKALKNSSQRGDVVVDLFGGSGTTLIAAAKLDRRCYMMELDPRYCDVIRKRYARLQGKESEWELTTGPAPSPSLTTAS